MDAALLAHAILAATPGLEIEWRQEVEARDLYQLIPVEGSLESGGRAERALADARAALERIPRKRWRKRSLRRIGFLGLDALDEEQGILLLDALGARRAGDPETAAILLRDIQGAESPPILIYQLGASRIEAGDLLGAAETFELLREAPISFPLAMRQMAGASRAFGEGRTASALRQASRASKDVPYLPEPHLFRALVSREACRAYRPDRILEDIAGAFRAHRCCASCALLLSELHSFTGQPWLAADPLKPGGGCEEGALDSARDRARALYLAAAGALPEALAAAASAESRDAGPLRAGMAPVFLLVGDNEHLREAYESEGDPGPDARVSMEKHLYAGLNALWTGRPSEAATQFERGGERALETLPEDLAPRGSVQLLKSLRIRALMTAGRIEEAVREADEARAASGGDLHGLYIYSAAQSDLAWGRHDEALREMRRLVTAADKFWRYLVSVEAAIMKGNLRHAKAFMRNALMGIDTQINICPGIPTEPYLLQAQARYLLAVDRPDAAERILTHLLSLGPRGLFAPDVVVPAWELLGRTREILGDPDGAAAAYHQLLERWGEGEDLPVLERVRERILALEGAGRPRKASSSGP
jgi:tetratricopeptide (TPR) repeat protein